MDVSALLTFSSNLGCPQLQQLSSKNSVSIQTPNLELLALSRHDGSCSFNETFFLAVAWTEAACSAQLFCGTPSTSFTSPVAIWPDSNNSSSEHSQKSIVCVKVAGGCTTFADKSNSWNIAVLVATPTNQVYSIPMVAIITNEGQNQHSMQLLVQPALKVFPDQNFCSDYLQMHSCHVNEGEQHLIVQDIMIAQEPTSKHTWIIFSSGTAIRISLEACFPEKRSSYEGDNIHNNADGVTLSETNYMIQIHLLFPSSSSFVNKVLPLSKYHEYTSLLPPEGPIYEALSFGDSVSSMTFYSSDERFTGKVAVSVGLSGELVAAPSIKTMINTNCSSHKSTITGNIIGGTKAVVKGVFGSLWKTLGSYSSQDYDVSNSTTASDRFMNHDNENWESEHLPALSRGIPDQSKVDHYSDDDTRTRPTDEDLSFVPVVHKYLLPQQTLLDPPRKITSVSIDPLGKMVAVADTLGRVMLIDLCTKQIVRMWKGLRDSQCYWIVHRPCTFLVIHSRQRSLIEFWRMMHGPRIRKIDLISPLQNKNPYSYHRVIQCSTLCHDSSENKITNCYLIEDDKILTLLDVPLMETNPLGERTSGSDNASQPTVEKDMSDSVSYKPEEINVSSDGDDGLLAPTTSSSVRRGPALQLQLLNQLLSEEGSTPPTSESIYKAITQITSLTDLNTALDLVSSSAFLEEGLLNDKMDVTGFYTRIVNLCRDKLASVLDVEQEHLFQLQQASSFISGSNLLRRNIQFHTQIIEAYELIRRFEIEMFEQEDGDSDMDMENSEYAASDDGYFGAPRTPWAEEAMAWIRTYEEVSGRFLHSTIDEALTHLAEGAILNRGRRKHLRFSTLFKACRIQSIPENRFLWSESEQNQRILIELCDSSKERAVILSHLFHPLLKDIFVFKVVNSIYTILGLNHNFPLMEHYFGEWFMSLSAREASRASLYDMWCPILRWLQDIIAASYDADSSSTLSENNALKNLQKLCSEASDLPRAFLLAVVCREAVLITSKQYEAKTYGKVSSKAAVLPWDKILRKIRLCLLVSLRLGEGERNPIPITVANVEAGDVFSVFQWIARDQLTLSHKQDELENVEIACRTSRLKLHPSLPECDSPPKWKILQGASKAHRNSGGGERASLFFFTEKADQPGPLLLYLNQFNLPIELAAHRALLLGEKWGKEPASLHLIKDAVSALRVLQGDQSWHCNIACAVRLEIWQTRIRPVYRAVFFGFDDVPELSMDVIYPLIHDVEWLRSLANVAAEVLSLIERTPKISEEDYKVEVESNGDEEGLNLEVETAWPAVKDDVILSRLVQRTKAVNVHSLHAHKGIICAAHLAEDMTALVQFAPSFGDVFLAFSLFREPSLSSTCTNEQLSFVKKSVYKKAREFSGPLLNRFDLEEIENLGKAWGFTERKIRSEFILSLYLFGKDAVVIDFPTEFSNIEEAEYFIFEGLSIVCIRIHATLKIITQVKQFRPILSILDAETCRWVRDQTENGLLRYKSLGWDGADSFPSLSATHELVLKLVQLSLNTGDKLLIEKSHALSLLNTKLLRAIQDQQDAA